jgi:hypothetical protein
MTSVAQPAKENNGIHVGKDEAGGVNNIYALIAQASDEERAEGMAWYTNAHNDVVKLAEITGRDLWTVCQVLSVISPQRRWEQNVHDCQRAIEAHALPVDERIPYLSSFRIAAPAGWKAFIKAWNILDGSEELVRKGAPKTYDFAMTIYQPSTYMLPVIDSHAGALWTDKYHLVGGCFDYSLGLYTKIANDYVQVSASMGVLPSQAQAIAWVVRRRLLGSSPSSM